MLLEQLNIYIGGKENLHINLTPFMKLKIVHRWKCKMQNYKTLKRYHRRKTGWP